MITTDRTVRVAARRTPPASVSRAIVVFEDRASVPYLRWLRPGFRHCFCLVRRPVGWIVCDPLKSSLHLEAIAGYDETELIQHYSRLEMTALVGNALESTFGRGLVRPLTCVEVVKRVLGLRAPGVWTPYQLYRALRRLGFAPSTGSCETGA